MESTNLEILNPFIVNQGLQTLGRIIFSIPFAVMGILQLMLGNRMAEMLPKFVPAPTVWVYVTGICLVLAALSIIVQRKVRLATRLLALLLFLFIFIVHIPGLNTQDPIAFQMAINGVLKDLGLSGAALFISGMYKE